jgi:hypothetical protein
MSEQGWPTLADVHAAVLRVDGRVALLTERHDGLVRELATRRADDRRELDDHEARLRALSRWRWLLAGGLTVVTAAGGVSALTRLVGIDIGG